MLKLWTGQRFETVTPKTPFQYADHIVVMTSRDGETYICTEDDLQECVNSLIPLMEQLRKERNA